MEGRERGHGCGGLVLAAGASERFGGRPKALLDVDGEPAVVRIVRSLREAGVPEPVVVVGHRGRDVRAALEGHPARVVDHAAWAEGRTGSVQAGLRALEGADPIVLWPVDHPFVEAKTVRALLDAVHTDPVSVWFLPTYHVRSGHPVVLRASVGPRIRALGPDAPLRSLLPSIGAGVRRLPVSDPGVLENVDTPELFERARADHRDRRGA